MIEQVMNILSDISGMEDVLEVCGGTKEFIEKRNESKNIRFTIIHNSSDEFLLSRKIIYRLAQAGYTRQNEPIVCGLKGNVLCFDFSK